MSSHLDAFRPSGAPNCGGRRKLFSLPSSPISGGFSTPIAVNCNPATTIWTVDWTVDWTYCQRLLIREKENVQSRKINKPERLALRSVIFKGGPHKPNGAAKAFIGRSISLSFPRRPFSTMTEQGSVRVPFWAPTVGASADYSAARPIQAY